MSDENKSQKRERVTNRIRVAKARNLPTNSPTLVSFTTQRAGRVIVQFFNRTFETMVILASNGVEQVTANGRRSESLWSTSGNTLSNF